MSMNFKSGLFRPRQHQTKLISIFRKCCDVNQVFYFAARFLILRFRNTFIKLFQNINFFTAFLYRDRYLYIMSIGVKGLLTISVLSSQIFKADAHFNSDFSFNSGFSFNSDFSFKFDFSFNSGFSFKFDFSFSFEYLNNFLRA